MTDADRPFSVRYREMVEREHLAKRGLLAAQVAELRVDRAENLVAGVWRDDTELEHAEAALARLDAAWAADCVEWDRTMERKRAFQADADLRASFAMLHETCVDLDASRERYVPIAESLERIEDMTEQVMNARGLRSTRQQDAERAAAERAADPVFLAELERMWTNNNNIEEGT